MRGVTLVELLVVLVVIGVALSIVAPSMTNSYDAWQLRSTGRELLAILRFAAQNARGASLICYYKDGQFVAARDGSVVKKIDIPSSIVVEPKAPRGAMFLPTGQMVSVNEFTLTNQRGKRIVVRSGPLY